MADLSREHNDETRKESPSSPGRIGAVGAGDFGRFCIEAFARVDDLQVVGVADPNPVALGLVDAPGARLWSNWRDLIEDSAIEVVYVATPPFVRREIIETVLAAKKSVFSEKPLALSLDDADDMIACAERNGVTLGVNYVMRHLAAYDDLVSLASSGYFGAVRTISFENFAKSVPAGHWFWDPAKGGGILVEHGVHFIDAYGRIAGAPVRMWGTTSRPEAVDVGIEYETGAIARFFHEFAYPRSIERALGISMFERGAVTIAGWIPTRLSGVLADDSSAAKNALMTLGYEPRRVEQTLEFEHIFPDRQAGYGAAIVAGMRDVVARHRSPSHRMKVTAGDARESLRVALLARDACTSESRQV